MLLSIIRDDLAFLSPTITQFLVSIIAYVKPQREIAFHSNSISLHSFCCLESITASPVRFSINWSLFQLLSWSCCMSTISFFSPKGSNIVDNLSSIFPLEISCWSSHLHLPLTEAGFGHTFVLELPFDMFLYWIYYFNQCLPFSCLSGVHYPAIP